MMKMTKRVSDCVQFEVCMQFSAREMITWKYGGYKGFVWRGNLEMEWRCKSTSSLCSGTVSEPTKNTISPVLQVAWTLRHGI